MSVFILFTLPLSSLGNKCGLEVPKSTYMYINNSNLIVVINDNVILW